MRHVKKVVAAACTVALLSIGPAAQAAEPECFTQTEGNISMWLCPAWALAPKPTISVRINGKKKITYKGGKAKSFTFTQVSKGMPITGMCKMRQVAKLTTPRGSATSRDKWTTIDCLGLNLKMTIANMPLNAEGLPKALVPATQKIRTEIKTPGGAMIRSNWVTVRFAKAYKPPK